MVPAALIRLLLLRTREQVVRSLAPWHEPAPPRPPVEHKRVWASLAQNPAAVLDEAFREGLRRDPERQKTWVGLVDGRDNPAAVAHGTGAQA